MKNKNFQEQFRYGLQKIKIKRDLQIEQIVLELSKKVNRKISAVRYWQKGNPPIDIKIIEALAMEMVKISDGELGKEWLLAFLHSANHPSPMNICSQVFSSSLYSKAISLPTKPFHNFIGRENYVMEIQKVLEKDEIPVITISGLGGIGKTALMRQIFELQIKSERFDHYIWIDDNNDHEPISHEKILSQIGLELGIEKFHSLSSGEKTFFIRHHLSGKKLLLALDDMENSNGNQDEILKNIYPVLRDSKILAASRIRFQTDVNSYPILLIGLSADETFGLITQESIIKNIEQAQILIDKDLEQIFDVTGGSPEAIRLIVGQMLSLSLASILRHLRGVTPIARNEEDLYLSFYREIYMQSWKLIDHSSKVALIGLAQFPVGNGGDFSALMATTNLNQNVLERSLHELWRYSLVEINHKIQRYFLHHLTRNFVCSEFSKKQ